MSHTRREFLQGSASCAGYLVGSLALAHTAVRCAFAANPSSRVVAEEAFARIEAVADGVWAVVSTPLKDGGRHFTTTSNGGIVVGKDGVLVIEGYYTNEGGAWLATKVRELTGREPTHVVVTHYHADHVRGLAGIGSERAPSADPLRIMTTPTTRGLLEDNEEKVLPEALIDEDDRSTRLDLGGRTVEIVARKGHTASDVTLHLAEPRVVWCGDLVWNGMFPNYVDAIPSHLTRNCEAILDKKHTTYVPGHGDATDA
jgi:glyoxylase-like metal-dependent hydrolase (beta-lactamase superfamily II)